MVSVIVPVYNNEKYLDQCIKSIIGQTYHRLQIILINDGSTDGSREICEKYAGLDNRIRYLNQPNSGVSHARNAGLEIAEGEYICFVDSDDVLPPDSIETRVALLENTRSDLCVCCHREIHGSSEAGQLDDDIGEEEKRMSSARMMDSLFDYSIMGYQGYLWDKLFVADLINSRHVRFAEGIYYNEDRLFIFEYLRCCREVSVGSKCVYWYRINSESAMGKQSYSEKMKTELDAYMQMGNILRETDKGIFAKAMKAAADSSIALNRKIPRGHPDKAGVKKYAWYYVRQYCRSGAGKFPVSIVLLLKCLMEIMR